MKTLAILFVSVFLFVNTQARTWYVSSSDGDDEYTVIQAGNPTTPWKSLDKINASVHLLQYGDTILFKRNDTFYGSINFKSIRHKHYQLTLGAYGKGEAPVITGMKTITSWQPVGEHLWKTSCSEIESLSNLYLDGKPLPMGRYPNVQAPNKGYLLINSHEGKLSISTTSTSLVGSHWTGAEAVVRSERWILDRVSIRKHEGQLLEFGQALSYEPHDNGGFFIQNHLKTLDVQNEWYYDRATHDLYFYSIENPASLDLQFPSQDVLFQFYRAGKITIQDLEFQGANLTAASFDQSYQITLKNLKISHVFNGIEFTYSNNIEIIDCHVNQASNNGITGLYCNNAIVEDCSVRNTALISGHGSGGDMQYIALHLTGDHGVVRNNTIDSVGYIGIYFHGTEVNIVNNQISNFCSTKDDGGGIYSFSKSDTILHHRVIEGNIITHGIGAPEGTPYSTSFASGIYLDDHASDILVKNNTISRCGHSGIYIRNANRTTVTNNMVFNNGAQLVFLHDLTPGTVSIEGTHITENTFISNQYDQPLISIELRNGTVKGIGMIDDNHYIMSSKDSALFRITTHEGQQRVVRQSLDLTGWQKTYGMDLHSIASSPSLPPAFIYSIESNDLLNTKENKFHNPWWGTWSSNGNMVTRTITNSSDSSDIEIGFQPLVNSSIHNMGVIFTPPVVIEKGMQYLLSFKTSSTIPGSVYIKIRQDTSATHTAWEGFVNCDTNTTLHYKVFSPQVSYKNARIYFEVPEDESNLIRVSDIKLLQVSYTLPELSGWVDVVTNTTDSVITVQIQNKDNQIETVHLAPFLSVLSWHNNKDYFKESVAGLDIQDILAGDYPDVVDFGYVATAWNHPISLILFAFTLLLLIILMMANKPHRLVWALIPLTFFFISVALSYAGILPAYQIHPSSFP